MIDREETTEALGIIHRGEEVPGILAFGLWVDKAPRPYPLAEWPDAISEVSAFHNGGWEVLEWRLVVRAWPSPHAWLESLHRLLATIVEAGACLSWTATEGNFADPPGLFDPQVMGDGVYAAYGGDVAFICSAFPGEPFRSLPSTQMKLLRQLTHQYLGVWGRT